MLHDQTHIDDEGYKKETNIHKRDGYSNGTDSMEKKHVRRMIDEDFLLNFGG